jgi:hypothetical protein
MTLTHLHTTHLDITSQDFASIPHDFFDQFQFNIDKSDDEVSDMLDYKVQDTNEKLMMHIKTVSKPLPSAYNVQCNLKSTNLNRSTWILDSGTTSHICYFQQGLVNLVPDSTMIKIGNGKTIQARYKGDYPCTIVHVDGTKVSFTMHDVLVIPDATFNLFNLFSFTKALNRKGKLGNVGHIITFQFNDKILKFDRMVLGGSAYLPAACIVCQDMKYNQQVNTYDLALATTNEPNCNNQKKIDMNKLHEMLGHANKDESIRVATYHKCDWTV